MPDQLALFGGPPIFDPPHACVWPRLDDRHARAVLQLIERNEVSYYGREGAAATLEAMWAERLGGGGHTLAVSSGTAALHSAFFALGAEPGVEVLCPTNTFLATVMPLVALGATPVLCDADPRTGNLDPADAEARVTARTAGIVVTHLWGHPCAMDDITALARRHGLWLVEDCSHAHGSTYHDRPVGTFGDAAVFSFQGAKAVYAGQGGLLVARDREVFERAVLFGHFRVRAQQDVTSSLQRYASTGFGLNYRIHPFAAALAVVATDDLDDLVANRTKLLGQMTEALEGIDGLEPPRTLPGCSRGNQYGYKVRLLDDWRRVGAARLEEAFAAEGMDIHRLGSAPLHLQPFFADAEVPLRPASPLAHRPYRPGDLPVSEELWRHALSFPTFSFPDEQDVVARYGDGIAKVGDHLAELPPAGR